MSPVGLILSDDIAKIDRDLVWDFMSKEAYWARWRGRDDVERQLESAWRLVGAYQAESGAMLGFARAISDGVALAYLADVFVVPSARGRGVGKALLHFMIEEGPGASFRWMLHTADAHDLYRGFGFAEPDGTFLERRRRP
jgi:GNAT superfamily N-acetyltransferase